MKARYLIWLLFVCLAFVACKKHNKTADTGSFVNYKDVKTPNFNADSAYYFVKKQCDFGPRTPQSEASKKCASWLIEYLTSKADTVYVQEFSCKMWNGKEVKGKNIIASFNPQKADRVMFCSHWDSRLWADQDEDTNNRHKPILGANDGASGVGVLLEIARLMKGKQTNQGLDIILFDMEDQGAPEWSGVNIEDQTDWCLGSQYWAQNLHIPYYKAKYGILLDMVGGHNIRFAKEMQSMGYASTIMNNVWNIAKDIGYENIFVDQTSGSVMDDHIWINHYAQIPTIDIVNNDVQTSFFPYWHTTKDDMQCIDKNSLDVVGKVLLVSFFAAE